MQDYQNNGVPSSNRDWYRTIVTLIAALVPFILINTGINSLTDPPLIGAWFAVRGKIEAPQTVSIVRLDQLAYEKIRSSPVHSSYRSIAECLRKISAAGARAIIIDSVMSESSGDKAADEALAQAIQATPTFIAKSSEISIDTDPEGRQVRKKIIHQSFEPFVKSAKGEVQTAVRINNGIVREISLSNDYYIVSADRVPLLAPLQQFVSTDIQEPGGDDLINFYGPPSTIASISMGEVLGEAPVSPEYFKDRVVFIGQHSDLGVSSHFGKDTHLTPVSSEWMFGVEILATTVANLIEGSWIRRLHPTLEGLIVSLAVLHVSLLIFASGPLTGVCLGIAAILGWLALSYYSFAHLHYFLPGITFTLIIVIVMFLQLLRLARRNAG